MAETYEFRCPNCGAAVTERTLQPGQRKRCRACRQKVVIPRPPLDERPYGAPLAERVATFLETQGQIPGLHPYFDEVCLVRSGGAFLYGYGGESGLDDQMPVIRRFADRAAFTAWLAAQSDAALNRGPQAGLRSSEEIGITRRLLEAAVGRDPSERE